jgi:ATP-dependent DNA helicase RecQ
MLLPWKGINMVWLKEMEQVASGTKLNIKYWIDDMWRYDQQEEILRLFLWNRIW